MATGGSSLAAGLVAGTAAATVKAGDRNNDIRAAHREAGVLLQRDAKEWMSDREIQIIMMAGTNVTYGDATVSSRAAVTTTMTISDTILLRAKIVMGNNGAPTRSGPSNMSENAKAGPLSGNLLGAAHYVAVGGLEIMADIQNLSAAASAFQTVNVYNGGGKAIYTGEVGQYRNFRFVESNFIPRFRGIMARSHGHKF